jgi:L-lactate dehydrogenase
MKIGIVGSGFVGATIAYAVLLRKAATEIVLIDINTSRAAAEAADISHAVPFSHPCKVYAGDYAALKDSGVIVITAGVNQKPGETRLQLVDRNARVIEDIIPRILEYAPNTKILMTTNPVDVMTHIAYLSARNAGNLQAQVFGSGTTLDTARFRSLLSNVLGVDPQHVHGYVIGEHGDSEVLTWSIVDIGGLPLNDFVRVRDIKFGKSVREQIDKEVRQAAYTIIEGKGATYYGIGVAVANIVDVIAHKQRAILTICSPLTEIGGIKDVTVSMPHLLSDGEVVTMLPLNLNKREMKALSDSAGVVRQSITAQLNRSG